jgi:ComF family protein
MKIKNHYLKKIAAWLLPYTCLFCSASSSRQQDICQACLDDLPKLENPCPRCAKPLPFAHSDLTCGECIKLSPPFDFTHALFAYESPITRFIMQLKFNHALVNARILGELLTEKIQRDWYQHKPLPNLIIPMPLHPNRLKERGFNQAIEIARPIAKSLQLPLQLSDCLRIKETAAQATLLAKERQYNIKQAFKVNKNFSGQHIAVIDDVITTGHTMTEFCKSLKKAGASKIDVWCCARPYL